MSDTSQSTVPTPSSETPITHGLLDGEELPEVSEDGLSMGYCEQPHIALAPASTFEDGSKWRYHYGMCMEKQDRMPVGGPGYILIRDDLNPGETRQAVIDAVGTLFVDNFGPQLPELPTPPVYRCEGEDDSDTPWPIVSVPAELWAGCSHRPYPDHETDGRIEPQFFKWNQKRKQTAGWSESLVETQSTCDQETPA